MSNSLDEMETYLTMIKIPLRLSCKTHSGWPMILSLWYLYEDGRLYCATQDSSKVVRYLEHEPRCAFEIAGDLPPYCGIRGQDRALLDPTRGGEILEKLLHRYQGNTETSLAKRLMKKKSTEVAIILEPINLFQWDFSGRMEPISPESLKLNECPQAME